MSSSWRPTRSFGRAAVLGVFGLAAGAVSGRPDLAVVAVPLLAAAVWALLTRPRHTPRGVSRLQGGPLQEGEEGTWRVDVTAVPGLREVVAHLPGSRWALTRPRHGHTSATADGGDTVTVAVALEASRWGAHRLGPAQVVGVSDLAAFTWVWPGQAVEHLSVTPTPGSFTSRAAVPHPVGLVGNHRSTRPGTGSEPAEIRPFRPGDRLRRIHWPVSLRTGDLHVTTSHADEDAEVRLVVDAVRDVGRRDVASGRFTSLDVAVEAAGALAAHYLRTGDRVGLTVLGGSPVDVPAVGGHHQLARILGGLGRAEPSRGTVTEARLLQARLARRTPPGAVVVMLSALVAPEPLAHAVRLSRSGHVVIVVDTLPPDLVGPDVTAQEAARISGIEDPRVARLVWRLWALDRERRVRRCVAAGVPVVPWGGAGSLDGVLRGVARRGRAPRVGAR